MRSYGGEAKLRNIKILHFVQNDFMNEELGVRNYGGEARLRF